MPSLLTQLQNDLAKINTMYNPFRMVQVVYTLSENIASMYTHLVDNKTPAADEMFPILMYVLLFSNPDGLLSSLEYMRSHLRPSLMTGEYGYVLVNMTGAI